MRHNSRPFAIFTLAGFALAVGSFITACVLDEDGTINLGDNPGGTSSSSGGSSSGDTSSSSSGGSSSSSSGGTSSSSSSSSSASSASSSSSSSASSASSSSSSSASSASSSSGVMVVCGNGMVEMGEQCDDGNKVEGDNCGRDCQTEHPGTCPGTAIHLAQGMDVTVKGDTTGATDKFMGYPGGLSMSCGSTMKMWTGPDWVYAVQPEVSGTMSLTLTTQYDNPVLHVRTACAGGPQTEIACERIYDPGVVNLSMPVTAGVIYYVAADAFSGTFGTFSLTLSLQ